MNKLQIVNHNGQLLVDSRDVAEMVERNHADLLRNIRGYMDILGKSNFALADFFIESYYSDAQGKPRLHYLITRKGCDMVANKMTGEKGVLFTAAYVTKFEEMEKSLRHNLPTTYKEALIQLVAQVEENERLQEEKLMLNEQVVEMKPKAQFFDQVASSKDAIDIGTAAKVLKVPGVGRNKLFEILRQERILMRNNQPYQTFVDRGYFRVVEQKYTKPNGETHINIKTLVYQRGLDFIRKTLERSA